MRLWSVLDEGPTQTCKLDQHARVRCYSGATVTLSAILYRQYGVCLSGLAGEDHYHQHSKLTVHRAICICID